MRLVDQAFFFFYKGIFMKNYTVTSLYLFDQIVSMIIHKLFVKNKKLRDRQSACTRRHRPN